MIPLIESKRDELVRLCERYRVRTLELFGSAARDDFTEESDLDFLVEFEQLAPGQAFRTYIGLLRDLEALFGRHVDLVMPSAVTNPYFRAEIERTRRVLYAAA